MEPQQASAHNTIRFLLAVHIITAGIYAGACLYLALVDLPLFDSLSTQEYARTAKVFLPRAGALMIPGFLIPLFTSLFLWLRQTSLRRSWLVVGLCFLTILGVSLAVHIPINIELLSENVLSPDRLSEVRQRWGVGHWIRTGFALLAVGISVVTVSRRSTSLG